MPLYFAYGSNMDEAALRTRCPKARAVGLARLARHRFVLMGNGYASVHRDPVATVHGVLFELALSDIPPLDRYEETGDGLYTKLVQPVVRHQGAAVRALLYIGNDTGRGAAPSRYMEAVVAAAKAVGLPAPYVTHLESLAGPPGGAAAKPLKTRPVTRRFP